MKTTTIREAELRDIPRILDLYEDLTGEKRHIKETEIQRAFNSISALPEHRLLVAEYNGVVVGTLFVLVVANLSHGARPWAILENMIVDGNYRNKGIGHMLIDFALDFCRDAGCYKAQLLSNVKRDNAHRFYRSAGFQDSALGFRRYLP